MRLPTPIPATFAGAAVSILEIGILGAKIRHERELDGARGELRFFAGESEVALRCDVVRTTSPGADPSSFGNVSGLRFTAAVGESGDHLRSLLADLVARSLEARHDASAPRIHLRSVDGDRTVRGVDAQFVSFRLEGGLWRRRASLLPEQPPVGFTVARGEDADEMKRLCEVYEASDEEGRRLIRLFAELSVTDALQIPPSS